jgi:hypothetical protein
MGNTMRIESGHKRAILNKLLLVEGEDEEYLFDALLEDLKLEKNIQVFGVGGKDKFPNDLEKYKKNVPGFEIVTSLGIIRDADNDPQAAFQSVCSALNNAGLPVPNAPLQSKDGPPKVTIMIVPDSDRTGMLEDLCLDSVSDDPAMPCIDQYFECLRGNNRILTENDIPKARVRAFLVSREWLEIAYFEYLQTCMGNYRPNPVSAATVVPRAHLFLASRYTPDLRLGIAAKKTDDRYWQFNHATFDKSKMFLQML